MGSKVSGAVERFKTNTEIYSTKNSQYKSGSCSNQFSRWNHKKFPTSKSVHNQQNSTNCA